jgi:hypothetical protein
VEKLAGARAGRRGGRDTGAGVREIGMAMGRERRGVMQSERRRMNPLLQKAARGGEREGAGTSENEERRILIKRLRAVSRCKIFHPCRYGWDGFGSAELTPSAGYDGMDWDWNGMQLVRNGKANLRIRAFGSEWSGMEWLTGPSLSTRDLGYQEAFITLVFCYCIRETCFFDTFPSRPLISRDIVGVDSFGLESISIAKMRETMYSSV